MLKSSNSSSFPGLGAVLGWIAVALAIGGQVSLERDGFIQAGILFGVALVVFVARFRRSNAGELPKAPSGSDVGGGALPFTRGALPLLSAATLAALAAVSFDVDAPAALDWWLHASSLMLLVLVAGFVDRRRPRPTVSRTGSLQSAGLLLSLLLLALFMRVFRLGELPFGTWFDEAENGLQALRGMEIPGVHAIYVGSINATLHYLQLIVFSFRIFGVSTEAIRYVSVIMGVGTVLAAFWVGSQLFNRPMGLVFGFLMAVSRWNVTFSRIGMYNITTPLFQLLSLGFLLRAVRTGRLRDFALAGVCIGLGLNFYTAFQLFVLVIAIFVVIAALEDRSLLARSWRGLLLMAVTAVITVAPVAKFALESPDTYFARTQETSILANKTPAELPSALAGNVQKHVRMFNYRGDPNGRHNLPFEPTLDPVSAGLMILGLGLCLSRLPRPGALRLPVWLGVALLGGILSLDFEAPQSLRSIGALPAVYLLAVVPLHELWESGKSTAGRHRFVLSWMPLILLLSLAAVSNYRTYFHRQANDLRSWMAHSTPETITAGLLNRKPVDAGAYVTTFHYDHPTLRFLARGVEGYERFETYDWLPIREPATRDVALILNHDGKVQFEETRRLYPNARFEEIRPAVGGEPIVYHAYLSSTDLAGIQGLAGTYRSPRSESAELTRRDASLSFDWREERPMAGPFSVEWQGILSVGSYGFYRISMESPQHAELHLGRQRILAGSGSQTAGMILPEGNHALRVLATGGDGVFRLSWQPPDGEMTVIPPWALHVPPVTGNGLLGRYYPNPNWEAPEAFARIDPEPNIYFHVLQLPRPYTVEWTGQILISEAGRYAFGLRSADESTLYLDDQEVVRGIERDVYAEGSIELDSGAHDIRIRLADRTHHTYVQLYWTPPGAGRRIVPREVLSPPRLVD